MKRDMTSIRKIQLFLFGIAAPKSLLCSAFFTSSPHRNAFIITPSSSSPKILPSCPLSPNHPNSHRRHTTTDPLYIYAPKGSGYISTEDEMPDDPIPETYKPTMGYPEPCAPVKPPKTNPTPPSPSPTRTPIRFRGPISKRSSGTTIGGRRTSIRYPWRSLSRCMGGGRLSRWKRR